MENWRLAELQLADDKMLRKEKLGSINYCINEKLFNLLVKR